MKAFPEPAAEAAPLAAEAAPFAAEAAPFAAVAAPFAARLPPPVTAAIPTSFAVFAAILTRPATSIAEARSAAATSGLITSRIVVFDFHAAYIQPVISTILSVLSSAILSVNEKPALIIIGMKIITRFIEITIPKPEISFPMNISRHFLNTFPPSSGIDATNRGEVT